MKYKLHGFGVRTDVEPAMFKVNLRRMDVQPSRVVNKLEVITT